MVSVDVQRLKAPFPWFGGKTRAASLIWERFGNVPNYVEPFAGSMATLLQRPHAPGVETINDRDTYVANFWRTLEHDPEAVAYYADSPVNEADLHARHLWLVQQVDFRERMLTDPDFYNAKIAGWWVWGICCWIGSGWCDVKKYERNKNTRPDLSAAGRGIHRKLIHLGDAGRGINRQLPHLGNAGRGIVDYFYALADRLRRVRVCCGDWMRVLGPSVTEKHGVTGILLDPPYSGETGRDRELYSQEDLEVSARVREWAIVNGDNPRLRIVLCGYDGEHDMPASWTCETWKAGGGYDGQNLDRDNQRRALERIWFSPACIQPASLFS